MKLQIAVIASLTALSISATAQDLTWRKDGVPGITKDPLDELQAKY